MDKKAALKTRLENLSPEQRAALQQQIARLRDQKGQPQNRPEVVSRYPLSLAQRRLWMLSQMGSEASAAYNIASVFCFDKGLDPERLQRAWRTLLCHHEVLCSAFMQEGNDLFQMPREASTWALQQHVLTTAQDVEAQLLKLASAEAARPFDLQHDWLLRVVYCATEAGPAGLVVVIHHSICDGLSITNMIRELTQYYKHGIPAPAGPGSTTLQYRDYVAYESRADVSKARMYWKGVFDSAPESLDALLDLPRPVIKDFTGASVSVTLPATDAGAFEAICHANNATLYMGLVALVQLLLARFANVGEVTLGMPVAGRPDARFDKVVGPFVNTIALRQAVDRRQTFSQLLTQVRRRVLEGFQHQGLAFDELVAELGFAKDPGRSPLYDAMLGLTSADEMALSFDGNVGRALRIPLAFSKVDLTFHFEKDRDGSLHLDLEYASGVLLETTARRLCDTCSSLAVAVTQWPARPLGGFALQSEEDRHWLVEQVNATSRPYLEQTSLVSEFRNAVQRYPHAIAVHAGDMQLSYRALDELSDQVARALMIHQAHEAGCRVALMLDKDERALIVILAIVKSRSVYVPLAANTPLARVADVVATGAVRLMFAESSRSAELQSLGVALLDINALLASTHPFTDSTMKLCNAADDFTAALPPAYLMFTSGSTGKPKGTLIEQRSVLRLVCNTDYHQVQANERVLLTGSLAFDAATFEIWGPLLNGGCVCIPAGTTLLDVHEFHTLVDHYQVDTAFLTTGLFNQLVDNNASAFRRLKTVLTGGEKISVEHIRKLMQAQPTLRLLHVYGPTENTTFSCWHEIREDELTLSTIPIGRPIANSRIYLLDQDMQPVPIGVPGEIYCGGDGIARGYVEEQNSDRSDRSSVFMADPFLPAGAGRLYRTGDLAKWNHRRELVFMGRKDRQVKIRGFRVELGEVEYHLRTLPAVTDAFVQTRGTAGVSELVAWLVAPDGTFASVSALREALKGKLPNYMLPAKVVCLRRLPLNASGKVDANSLPWPEDTDTDRALHESRLSQLSGQAEQDLARLYASVLGLTGAAALTIDRDANFFSMGGDSIRAIQLVSLARSGGYHFTLKDIFASETLAGLARTATIIPVGTSTAALLSGPMSPTQLWWLDQCGAPANHFNLSTVFKVSEPLNIAALRAAFDDLLELHPALRLTLDINTQQQSISDKRCYVLREVEAGQSRQQCWQQLQQDINLQAGVLLAVGVAQETDASYLAVVVHHLAADEVSGRLFAENLARVYQQHYQRDLSRQQKDNAGIGHQDVRPPVQEPVHEALGLINWAAQLRTLVERGDMDHDLAYWQDVVVRGRKILEQQSLVFADTNAVRDSVVLTLPQTLTQVLLRDVSAVLRMNPQEILLAAFIRAWQRMLNHTDCLLSLEGHGREAFDGLGDCSSTMGWFTSLYPFAFAGSVGSQLDLYRQVKDCLRRLPSKGFTYLPLRYYQDEETRKSLALRPQLSFNYLGEAAENQEAWLIAAGERAGDDHGEAIVQPFKLDVLAGITGGRFELTLRGCNPGPIAGLAVLADAWREELVTLSPCLQEVTEGKGGDPSVLSLSDSLVPFASLAELDATLAALRVHAAAVEEILPLTGMQAGMWLHCASHEAAYRDQVALRLQQPLDEKRFASAVRALVGETQALRTGFAQTRQGELLQIVFRERKGNYQYQEIDASLSAYELETQMVHLRATLREQQSDLLHDALFRLTLVRMDPACFELIIDFHHMALDGWTSALLLQRLEALYFGDATAGDSGAASGMRNYFEWLGRQSTVQARDYWQRLLGDYQNRSDVPAHQPRIPAQEPRPLFVETRAGATLHGSLLSWCARHGLTVNAAIQTLWGVFLARLTGSDDLVFGATVSGRDIELDGVSNMAGMLINTLPVRIRAGGTASFAERVRVTAQQFAESMSFGHLTLAEIQTLSPARNGLVTHALVFENYPTSDAAAARWQWQAQAIFDPMHFGFGLIVAPMANDLSFRFVADGSLYQQHWLEKMGSELCALLAALLEGRQPLDLLTRAQTSGWSLSANFTADNMLGLLQYHEYISGTSAAVTLLPYDQIVQELINPDSRLRRLQPQQHIVLWRPVIDEQGRVVTSATSEKLAELASALALYARTCNGTQLYFVPCPWYRCDWTLYREFTAYVRGALAGIHNTDVLSLEDLDDIYMLQQSCYPPELVFGDIPYSGEFFAAVANKLSRLRDLRNRRPVKVYVVDADDTLWGGIVGEEGVQGIRLDPVHRRLQQQLVDARAAGALICLATKNNEEDVRAVFEHRQMPLRWTHLTRVCAGWRPKSESILTLAEDLSLGLDSFVFIDDSPLECEQVLAACPGVLAIQLPPAPEREAFLNHLWLLDARAATREDTARAQMYTEELQRADLRKTADTYTEFLVSLDIRVDMQKVEPQNLPRTAQLSQRTNQFNTSGVRYTEAELATLLQEPGCDIRCISVSDKYGDYGLTGSVFIRRGLTTWTVFGLMLSCRVLGRGVEHTILRQLAQEAGACGVDELCVDFVRLPRNAPALQFLQTISGSAQTAQQSAASAWQFILPVIEAQRWQPGADDGDAEPEGSAAKQKSSITEPVAATQNGHDDKIQDKKTRIVAAYTQQLSTTTSGYYCYLASALNSGAAVLHEMQHQGVVQRTGNLLRNTAVKKSPVSPTELTLAGFFTELLGQSEIFLEDSFYDLGGHSLKAVMLFSRIALRYGLTLDFHDLQAYPTLAALAHRIDAAVSDDDPVLASAPALTALPAADNYPVSPGQSRLWMLEQLRAAGPSPFHMHATLIVAGSINRQALDRALYSLLLRHEALRTCFREDVDGRIRQVVVPMSRIGSESNSGHFPQKSRVFWLADVLDDAKLTSISTEQCGQVFDLREAPLLRIAAGALASGRNVLFITLHHIISDGWSVGILSRELSDFYKKFSLEDNVSETAFLTGVEHLTHRDSMQFRDFASWQLDWLASAAGERALQFWREHFARPVEALQLPAASPRPALMQSAGACVDIDVGASVWSAFKRCLSAMGISEFSGLFAALQLVLARLSGQQNFCIGTAVAGRQHPQLEAVIGFFVNVLPLRTTLESDYTVDSFMQAVAIEVNNCLSHQSVPFDTIVSSLDLVRDPGRAPLFDVMLVLQNTDIEDLRFGEHVSQVQPVASTTSQYDLTVSAFPATDGSLKLIAEYDSVIYSAANIGLILRCVERAITGLMDCCNEPLTNVPWLTEYDINRVRRFEHSGDALPGNLAMNNKTEWLPDIVRLSAQHAPGRIRDAENNWSFGELASEMERIATLLRAAVRMRSSASPARQQIHVGVIGKRSVHSIAAMLGVMDAGAVYIPLDLTNPFERLQLIIDEGAVDVLLSTDQSGDALAGELQQRRPDIDHVCYSDVAGEVSQSGSNTRDADGHVIAYMIFTSGSTGKPKGVQISHGAFATMIRQQIPAFDVQSDDVCAQFAALSFDASLSEIFLALVTGASLVIAPDETRADIDMFIQWLTANAITVITLPPVFLRALNKRPLGKLRVLVTAGEAAIGDDMRHYSGSLRVLNAYGPTETSVCASAYLVNDYDMWPFGVPIGKPLPGVMMTVRDVNGARVPVGVTGELYIGGATVGHGYFGAPELTVQKFSTISGDEPREDPPFRRYRSGDLVRWREDGLLEFLGRVDTQIKVRGYRIEPGEIEHAARQVEGVDDALALLHPQFGLLLYCVSCVTEDCQDSLRSTLAAVLARRLPRHMVPADIRLLDTFPLSSAGKIDRAALLALASSRESRFIAPGSRTEQVMAHAWRRILNAAHIGRHDDFFALGGDSIKALEVLSSIRALGFSCDLKDFFAAPQLSQLAFLMTPWHGSQHNRDSLVGNIDLLPVQSWFLHSRHREAARHFNIVAELKAPSIVSHEVLKQALTALIQNHDSLRARFYLQDGQWLQEIQNTLDIDDVLHCYRRVDAAGSQAEQLVIEELACSPFELETGPLFRCLLVQAPNGTSEALVLTLHHLIADWVSLRILITDLNALTLAVLAGDADLGLLSPPHLLADVTEERHKELASLPSTVLAAFHKAVALTNALAAANGVHNELCTLHLQVNAGDLMNLRAGLSRCSAHQQVEFRLQDVLLATVLGEMGDLLPMRDIPVLVESHGRDNSLDLSRQVAWLTRARLFSLDKTLFNGPDALMHAHRLLQADESLQPDVFACMAAEPGVCAALPALMSFNYLGEFANNQHPDDLFSLTGRVFNNSMAADSPVDVPLHMEFYVVDYALEIQLAWSPGMFEFETMRARWESVVKKLASL